MINLKVKDHSVSGEDFQLKENVRYGFLETEPKPDLKDLPNYYKSEDYISHTDTQRNLFEKVYHSVRTIALRKKLKLINEHKLKDKNVLDIGCGTGDFLQLAKENGWKIQGIEPDNNARAIANRKTESVVLETLAPLVKEAHQFDVITLWHVLEHLPDLEEQIMQFKKVLKTNGTLIVAVPNYKSFDARYYKSNWAAFDVPRHLWHFSQSSISRLFLTQKMKIVNTLPMVFDAYYVSLLSEKYKSGKMNILKSFYIGWRSNWKARRNMEYSSLIYVIKNDLT